MANFIKHFYVKKTIDFKVLSVIFNNRRNYSSALFIPGNKASQVFAYLSPDIDITDRLADTQKLQKELNLRGLNIDIQELHKTWDYYQYVLANRHTLEEKLSEINKGLSKVYNTENYSADIAKEKESLKLQVKLVKQDLRAVKEAIWAIEESIIPQVLKLPNEIDERTPPDDPVELKSIGEKPSIPAEETESHLDIGKRLSLLEYKNPIQYYLCNEAAIFELEVLELGGRVLGESHTRVAGPDFCRSILVEGCGMDHESPSETFVLQSSEDAKSEYLVNRLHLVGGASLPGLLAPYTKQAFKPYDLPLRLFTSGRHYTPFPAAAQGLFSSCQASALQALTLLASESAEEHEAEFQRLIDAASRIYDEIGGHYRLLLRSAKELEPAERLRVSFEMWSAHSSRYIEVGHVSVYGDYIARRLMIVRQTSKSCVYPATVGGTLLSVPRLLGCLMEEDPDDFIMPETLTAFLG